MFFNRNKKYLNCPFMKHSIHFFYDYIGACCTNIYGMFLYKNYDGGKVDWDYIYNYRKKVVKKINSVFTREEYPSFCEGCFELNTCMQDTPVEKFENKIKRIYFHQNQTCNAKCTYCAYQTVENSCKYKVVPIIKDMINRGLLDKYAEIYMSGGEITISSEFEELLFTLLEYIENPIEIFSSGIKYCKSIEKAFAQDKLKMMISLDSACRETYKRIKQVDCFDKVVENLKNYISASENAKKNLTLKYIIVDNVNDNETEITNFINLVKDLGIQNVRMDFDFEKYKYERNIIIPKKYYDLYDLYDKKAEEAGLTIRRYEQIEDILDKFSSTYNIDYKKKEIVY